MVYRVWTSSSVRYLHCLGGWLRLWVRIGIRFPGSLVVYSNSVASRVTYPNRRGIHTYHWPWLWPWNRNRTRSVWVPVWVAGVAVWWTYVWWRSPCRHIVHKSRHSHPPINHPGQWISSSTGWTSCSWRAQRWQWRVLHVRICVGTHPCR